MRSIKGWSIAGVFLVWAVMLLMRVGYLPPASANDDVWFAEEAYWLLNDGVLRSDWHQDALGSNERAYYPPITPVVQAGVFSLLGISQFSMGIAPTVFVILTVGCMVLALRQLGFPKLAWLFALAPFGVPDVFRYSLFLRYEFLVVFFLALAFLFSVRLKASIGNPDVSAFLIGVSSAMAGLSYYHVAPVCMPLGLALVLSAVPGDKRRGLTVWFACGCLLPLLAFASWIGADWRDFLSVMAKMAASYGAPASAGQMHFLVVAAALAFVMWSKHALQRRDFAMAMAWLLSAFVFMALQLRHRTVLPIAYFATWCAVAVILSRKLSVWSGRYSRGVDVLLAVPALVAALGLVLAANLMSRYGRDYAPVKAALLSKVNTEGLVVTEAAGWLALREVVGRGKLIHYQIPLPNGGPASLNTSKVLLQGDPAPISSLIIRPSLLDGAKTYSPALRAFLQSPDVLGPIPVSEREPYKLVMYVRRAGL
ncbi:MAG: hypothetical protein AABZ19_07570 [Pseudomonadota bacterium]